MGARPDDPNGTPMILNVVEITTERQSYYGYDYSPTCKVRIKWGIFAWDLRCRYLSEVQTSAWRQGVPKECDYYREKKKILGNETLREGDLFEAFLPRPRP